QVSPKAGLILQPLPDTTVRFAYTKSLGGASVNQRYQLEPSQVAGFIQSFRSIIPESVVGANVGAKFETFGVSLEQKFDTGTYLGVTGELLNSDVNRVDGAYVYDQTTLPDPSTPDPVAVPSGGVREREKYREPSLSVTANQLIGRDWSVGARYRYSQAVLDDNFVGIPDTGV